MSGFLALIRNRKRKLNILFFLITMSLAIWSFTAIIIYAETDKERVWIWYRLSSLGFSPFYALYVHFILVLLNKKINRFIEIILYIPACVLVCLTLNGVSIFRDFTYVHGQWLFIPALDSPGFYFYVAYYTSCMAVCVFLLYQRSLRTRSKRERKQARVIFISFIASFFIGTGDFFLPYVTDYPLPALAPLSLVIFIIGTWIAMIRYNFLEVSPSLVADRILANVHECVLILDPAMRIIAANSKIEEACRAGPGDLKGRRFSSIIDVDEALAGLLHALVWDGAAGDGAGAGMRIYRSNDPERVPYEADFSVIRDEFGDVLGVLVIARKTRGPKDFMREFRITAKQMEIIELTASGFTNVEIGRKLGITKRTVETHLNNIYNRLGISNKIELYNLLAKYNIRMPAN